MSLINHEIDSLFLSISMNHTISFNKNLLSLTPNRYYLAIIGKFKYIFNDYPKYSLLGFSLIGQNPSLYILIRPNIDNYFTIHSNKSVVLEKENHKLIFLKKFNIIYM